MNAKWPVGKHRGKDVVRVMTDDPKYIQHMTAQPWFTQKHQAVFDFVEQRCPDVSETPIHNAIQMKFLSPDFQVAFARAVGVQRLIDKTRQEFVRDATPHAIAGTVFSDWSFKREGTARLTVAREKLRELRRDRRRKRVEQDAAKYAAERKLILEKYVQYRSGRVASVVDRHLQASEHEFERYTDVRFRVQWGFEKGSFKRTMACHFYVEVKPSVGDDYPEVLRQMQRQREKWWRAHQKHQDSWWHYSSLQSCWVLLVDRFAARGANWDQLRDYFATNRFYIVSLQNVEDALPKQLGDATVAADGEVKALTGR